MGHGKEKLEIIELEEKDQAKKSRAYISNLEHRACNCSSLIFLTYLKSDALLFTGFLKIATQHKKQLGTQIKIRENVLYFIFLLKNEFF